MGTLLAAATLLVLSAPVASQTSTISEELLPDRESWYWRDNAKVNPPGTGQQQETFPVAGQQGHLQVALEDGEDDKRTYLGFDLSGLEDFDGATVRRFRLTADVSQPSTDHAQQHHEDAQEDEGTPVPPATSNAENAEFAACPVTTFMAGGADGDASTTTDGERNHPDFDCDLATGSASPDGSTWTFDLGAIAQVWADGATIDTAVVLKPALDPPGPPDPASSWTVEFHGLSLDGLSAQITYTPSGGSTALGGFSSTDEGETTGDEGSSTSQAPVSAPAPTSPDTSPPTPSTDEGTTDDGSQEVAQGRQAGAFTSDPRFTWYAALPWPLAALALGYAYTAFREDGVSGAAEHRVANRLRGRRLDADETAEIPAPIGS